MLRRLRTFEGRVLHALDVPSFLEWPREVEGLTSRWFVLFIAADARDATDEALREAARRAIVAGCRSLWAWGPDCSRVEEAFDRVTVDEVFLHHRETEDDVVMTTSHPRERLEEGLRYFACAATPARAYEASCSSWVAASVGSDGRAWQIEAALADPHAWIVADE